MKSTHSTRRQKPLSHKRVSERLSERAKEWAKRSAQAKRAVWNKRMSERCERTSERRSEWPSSQYSTRRFQSFYPMCFGLGMRSRNICDAARCLRRGFSCHTGRWMRRGSRAPRGRGSIRCEYGLEQRLDALTITFFQFGESASLKKWWSDGGRWTWFMH